MESLANGSAKELAERLSIESLTLKTVTDFNKETQTCMKRVQDTTELTTKVQQETEHINEMVYSLKNKDQQLQATFDKIDQLESLVNKVKITYNQVAENLDRMEKAVSASTPFRLGNRKTDIPVQPYFPPPNPVDIYDTNELFKDYAL